MLHILIVDISRLRGIGHRHLDQAVAAAVPASALAAAAVTAAVAIT